MRRLATFMVLLMGALAGCGGHEGPPTFDPEQNRPIVPTGSGRPAAGTDGLLAQGPPSARCLDGWVRPAPGTPLFEQAVAALRDSQGRGYAVAAARVFAGPTPAGGSGAHYYLDVRDRALRGRVLFVQAGDGPPLAAVAGVGMSGWRSPDWTGFRRDGGPPRAVPGLPGRWSGARYDAVAGRLLQPALAGCLDGT